jgi:hypothetical protein
LFGQYSVCLLTGRFGFDPRQRQMIFPVSSVSTPALRPIQPPVQWVPGSFPPGVKRGRGVALTTHPHLVTRSIMSRRYTSSPAWRLHGIAVQLYFTFTQPDDLRIYDAFNITFPSICASQVLSSRCQIETFLFNSHLFTCLTHDHVTS